MSYPAIPEAIKLLKQPELSTYFNFHGGSTRPNVGERDEGWGQNDSGYFSKRPDGNWVPIKVSEIVGWTYNSFYGLGSTFCDNAELYDAAGRRKGKLCACGGTEPNFLPPFDPLAEAQTNTAAQIDNLKKLYQDQDNSKTIIGIAILVFIIIIIGATVWTL